jgi:N-acetylglucosaminyldiphosphoundecaprenol N-acetyl-beta-D-mannosaminyltransferase
MILFGIEYENISKAVALEKIFGLLSTSSKSSVYFLNADCLNISLRDGQYRDILKSASLVLPDGIGLKIATKIFGGKMEEDCNGTDLSPLIMGKAAKDEYRIYLLGGREGVAEKAAKNISKQIAGIKIVGTNSGYFSEDSEIISDINNSGADILFVAMGVPLQEKWIAKHRQDLNPRLCLGVGALFDYLSGRIPRAPIFMRKIHLEWLWRIFIEPKRMFKRYIIEGAKLFWCILKYRLTAKCSELK